MDAGWAGAGVAALALLVPVLTAAIAHGMSRAKIVEHDKRLTAVETKQDGVASGVASLTTKVEVLAANQQGSSALQASQLADVRHDVKGLLAQMQAITNWMVTGKLSGTHSDTPAD